MGHLVDGYTALARQHGTPLYVYQLDAVTAAVRDLRAALPAPSTVYYSLKANPHPELIRRMREAGCGADVSSDGELAAAQRAGFTGQDCLYTGPAKTAAEIAAAVRAGVRRFAVESAVDLQRVADGAARLGTTVDCLLRIATGANGATGLRMTGGQSQFGIDAATVLADPAAFRDRAGARVVGAHFFPVSNARDGESLRREFAGSIATAAQLRDAGLPMSYVDLGGGFAAPYAAPGDRPRYDDLGDLLAKELDTHLAGWRDGQPTIAFESGRYLVGDCGVLICAVMDVKQRASHRYVLLDGGINHLGGLSGTGRMLPAATPLPLSPAEPVAPATIVGPLCTPADVIARAAPVSECRPGDLMVFPNVGAYGLSASLVAFLSRPAPVEVVLAGDDVVSVSRLEITRAP